MFIVLTLIISSGDYKQATVYLNNGNLELKEGVFDRKGVSAGMFADSLEDIGWGRLIIESNSNYNDLNQTYAAGMIEGYLTQHRAYQHRHNIFDWMLNHYVPGKKWPASLFKFLETNYEYTKENIKSNPLDPYWQVVGLMMSQFEGFVKGYDLSSPSGEKLNVSELYMYNSAGDLLDLAVAVSPELRPIYEKMSREEIMTRTLLSDHCTGLIVLPEDNSDIFFAQDAWFTYGSMNRVFKHYSFSLTNKNIAANKMSFSSYPGLLFSFDDHYVLSSGLAALETTNEIFNTKLYDKVKPQCVLEWIRVRVANWMSHDINEWAKQFSRENSGSYNNQWLVLDYKKFTPGNTPPEGTLLCLEQIPGYIKYEDITQHLIDARYMPSFNIPYFSEIRNMSGYPANDTFWSWEHCPRANILRRNSTKVKKIEDMMKLMRYNNYQVDPLSLDDPGNAPASRYDLKPVGVPRREAFGALDSKVTSYKNAKDLRVMAISSPTYDQQPIFKFSTCPFVFEHIGLPDEYHFPWILFKFDDNYEILNYDF